MSDSQVVPARDLSTENFSFDPQRRLIISPEYGSDTNLHLYLINIDNGIIYRWVYRMVSSQRDEEFGLDSLVEVRHGAMDADSAAIDPSTGIATIGNEGANILLILNLAAATFDNTSATFDAPDSAIRLEKLTTSQLTTDQATEPISHMLFLENEYGSAMAVLDLPANTSTGTIETGSYKSADLPPPGGACPSVSGWQNVGDPHGLAIFTSNTTGNNPMGPLINSSKTCAALVNLDLFLTLPREDVADSNVVDSEIDLITSGVLRYIEIPQP